LLTKVLTPSVMSLVAVAMLPLAHWYRVIWAKGVDK
jgi:hypothetical protein